jgi:hypothetical protein
MHSSTFVTCCTAERSAFRPSGWDQCRFRRARRVVRNHESPCIRPPRVTAWRQPYAAGSAVQDASGMICSLWVTRKRSALTNDAPIRCVATTPNSARQPGVHQAQFPVFRRETWSVTLSALKCQAFSDEGRRLLPRAQRAVEREVRHHWGMLT